MRIHGLMHRVMRLLFIGLLGLLSIGLVACDSGGDNGDDEEEEEGFPEPPGRPGFTASITGTASHSAAGPALHGVDLRSGDNNAYRAFALRLADENGRAVETRIVLLSPHADVPEPGTYAIGPSADEAAFTAQVTLPGRSAPLQATTGSLEVMRREDNTLVGRFRLSVDDASADPLTVTGAFRSTSAP